MGCANFFGKRGPTRVNLWAGQQGLAQMPNYSPTATPDAPPRSLASPSVPRSLLRPAALVSLGLCWLSDSNPQYQTQTLGKPAGRRRQAGATERR